MLRLQMRLALLLFVFLITAQLPIEWSGQREPLSETALFPCQGEECLALGIPLTLAQADLYSLQLIPFLSDTLAKRLGEEREYLLGKARLLESDMQHRALEHIKGIGSKKALYLKRYLDLSSSETPSALQPKR